MNFEKYYSDFLNYQFLQGNVEDVEYLLIAG